MFELLRAQRNKAKLDRICGKQAEALRKAGKFRERDEKLAEWNADGRLTEDEIDEILTRRLVKRAQGLDVPIPTYPTPDPYDEFWSVSNCTGAYILTRKGRAQLRDAIRKEKRERFESKARWITIFTGITGAAIGLVSVLTNLLVRLLIKH